MEFDVRLTTKSVFKILTQRAYSGQYGKMTLLGGIILIVLAIILLVRGETEKTYIIILFVLGVIMPCSAPFNIYRQAKSSVQEDKPDHYDIQYAQIIYTHLGYTMDIPWSRIGTVYEYPAGLVIDLKANQVTLIPRDCVPEIYDKIKEVIAENKEIVPKSGKLFQK